MAKVAERAVKKKILIIQLRRVGDVIFTLPVIGALKRCLPDAQIDFLAEPPGDQMARLHPDLSETLVYDSNHPLEWLLKIRQRKYDWVLDFHSNGRTLILTLASGAPLRAGFDGPITRKIVYTHLVQTTDEKYLPEQKLDILRAIGIPCREWSWGLKIPRAEAEWAEKYLKQSGVKAGEILVGLAPATRRPIRAWKEDRWAQVAEQLAAGSKKVLFLWGPGEKDLVERVRGLMNNAPDGQVLLPGETSLLQLAALIQKCSAVLAVDNGPKNMAVALDVPTVTLSGPTNPLSFDPHGDPRHLVVRPYGGECMENIAAPRVFESAEKILAA